MAALPNPAAERPLAFAVRHINASARDPIDSHTLLAALTAERVPAAYEHHVRAFFDEVEIETIGDLVRSGAVTFSVLAHGARRCLPSGHETCVWLDERA